MCDSLPEFVELLHCMFLSHPGMVAQTFADEEDMLTELMEGLGADEEAELSPLEDTDDLPEYAELVIGSYSTDPGTVLQAFAGHAGFVANLLQAVQEKNFDDSGDPTEPAMGLTDESDVLQLLEVVGAEKTTSTMRMQAATLLRSNLWIDGGNPQKILDCKGVKTLTRIMTEKISEDELVVKCCQTLDNLFDYRGVMKQADAATKQIITGKYIIAMGKTWDPGHFVDGKTQQPITDCFHVINYVPYHPNSLTPEEKSNLVLHTVTWVHPDDHNDPGAALPFIRDFLEEDGLRKHIALLGLNLSLTSDEFVAQAGAKTVAKAAVVDTSIARDIIQMLLSGGATDPHLSTALCCCLMHPVGFPDDVLAPQKAAIVDVLETLRTHNPDNDILKRKSGAVLKRLQ